MRLLTKKTGFSLTELIVTMSIIGVLAGIGLPAVNQVVKSFESSSRARGVVAAAMSNARARALANGKYTGIRFQCNAQGDQYMVFIEHDFLGTGLADGFRPVMGRNPIRLPKRGLVMDMHLRSDVNDAKNPLSVLLNTDLQIDSPEKVTDASTFCVVFSPAGKLVMHDVRIRNVSANDNVFNKNYAWEAGSPPAGYVEPLLFIDNYPVNGLGEELSRNHFVIVDKNIFNSLPVSKRWSRYLQSLKPFYINPYTGELID